MSGVIDVSSYRCLGRVKEFKGCREGEVGRQCFVQV